MCERRKLGPIWCQRLKAVVVTGKQYFVDPVLLSQVVKILLGP